jgi:transcriptional regulator of acetoin/glycerol metabolism
VIEVEDLPRRSRRVAVPSPDALAGEIRALEDVERDSFLGALDRNDGNQMQTAKQLGIGTATLYRKRKAYGKPAT